MTKRASIYGVLLYIVLAQPTGADFAAGKRAYEKGDYAAALKEWRPLAEQGEANAQYGLGVSYATGQGVPQDYTEAARWLRKAADQGYAHTQINLGLMCAEGKGVPQDDAEAVLWYRKAADQGHAAAQSKLGDMCHRGQGVPQDYVEAHMWFDLAASRASGGGQKIFADMRELVVKKMAAQQNAEAQRRAREWKPKSGANKSGRPMK